MILTGSQFSSHSSVFGEVHPPLSCRVPSPVKARRPGPRAFTCRPRDRLGHRRCQPRLTPPGSPGGHCDHSTRPAHRPGPRHQPEQPRLALAPRLSAAAASPGSTSTAGRCSSWTGPSVSPDRVRLCDRDRTGGRLEWAAALFRAFRWSLYRGAQLRVAGRDAPPGLREAGVIHREGLIAARRGLHADGSFAL